MIRSDVTKPINTVARISRESSEIRDTKDHVHQMILNGANYVVFVTKSYNATAVDIVSKLSLK